MEKMALFVSMRMMPLLPLFLTACAVPFQIDQSPSPPIHRGQGSYQRVGQITRLPAVVRDASVSLSTPGLKPSAAEAEEAIRQFQQRRRNDKNQMDQAWPPFLETMEAYLDQPIEALRASPLIRGRIAAEFELDVERRRPESFVADLDPLVSALLVRVDQQLRALQARQEASRSTAQETGRLSWPLSHGVLTSSFGYRRDPFSHQLSFHAGLDLAAPAHIPVYAAGPGSVAYAGWAGAAGRTVRIRHEHGTESIYAHLSLVLVEEGQQVATGDVLGLLGASGRATGPHLHFAIQLDGHPVDPLDELQSISMSFSQFDGEVVFGYGDE